MKRKMTDKQMRQANVRVREVKSRQGGRETR